MTVGRVYPYAVANPGFLCLTYLVFGVLIHPGYLTREFFSMPKVIGVEKRKELSAAVTYASITRSGYAGVVWHSDTGKIRMVPGNNRKLGRIVAGAIIYDDQFVILIALGEYRLDRSWKQIGAIECWDYYRNTWHTYLKIRKESVIWRLWGYNKKGRRTCLPEPVLFRSSPNNKAVSVKITFYGGAQTVTGSMHLLKVNGRSILIECGMFQGRRMESYEKNTKFPFDPSTIDAVVLTHAHIDHSGNLPGLVKQGYTGSIYATQPTADLCNIMLRDSAYLQVKDLDWVNKIRKKQGLEPMVPMYEMRHAEQAIEQFVGVEYNREITLAPGVTVRFLDGGHILGSASIHFELEENGRKVKLTYAGDIGRFNTPVINDPNLPRDQDFLVMESTYGDRLHGAAEDREEELAQAVRDATATGGRLIIPAFAIGRTQELVYYLHKLFNQNRIPDVPVYVDSPMACEATHVFRKHPECFDRETMRVFTANGEDPFEFARLTYVKDIAESKKLNSLSYPHVIISASGMAEGGRVLHHLRNNIGDRKNTILFVGYAVKNTLARRLMDGERTVKIFGEPFDVHARVRNLSTFSAHADRRDLLDYVQYCPPRQLKRIFLVHGDPEQAKPLRDALRSKGYQTVDYPGSGESFEV